LSNQEKSVGKKFFATDCEGPISKNDNALELAAHFLPEGEIFFARLSKYDDFLADVEKRPGYRAGDTLKLILPFFKAFGLGEKDIEIFSRNHILLLPRAGETLAFISSLMPCYIISTSYTPYIRSLCRAVGHPEKNSFSTPLPLDEYPIKENEKRRLEDLEKEIASLPEFDWPEQAPGFSDLPPESREIIQRLNQIFWDEIISMEAGRLLTEIKPVGGAEKAKALRQISLTLDVPLSQSFYAGDSITDVQVFREINQAGGISLSFNGNAYAIREAQVACLSANTIPMSVMAQVFHDHGPAAVFSLAANWGPEYLLKIGIRTTWVDALFPKNDLPSTEVYILNAENRNRISQQSSKFRKEVRGERIGGLG
jgi:energy-converting hydrogenase A subunit R